MDIKTMLEEIAPEIDESAAHDRVMALVRRRRRGVWVARAAAVAAVVAGFVAVALVTGENEPAPPADGSSTTAPVEPTTTVTSAPTVSAAPPTATVPPPTAAPSTTTTPSTTAAPTTTAPPPSTTIPIVEPTIVGMEALPDVSAIVRESTTQGPIVPMGNDDGDGSGCTPGTTGSLPDGLWYVQFLEGSVVDGIAYIEFDLACRYSDDERQAIHTPDEVIYDTSVRNDSPLLRTMPMAADAVAIVLDREITWQVWDDPGSYALVQADFTNSAWIKVVDGQILEVFQEFQA